MLTPGIGLNNRCSYRWQVYLAVADTYLIIARATIDWAVILGQEWNLGLSTAIGANYRVHLAWSTLALACTARRCTTSSAARSTTTRLIHQTFLLVELLFTGSEYEVFSALTTPEGFVYKVQLGAS